MKRFLPLILSLGVLPSAFSTEVVTSVPMQTDGLSRIKEQISGANLRVNGRHTDENIPGAVDKALRFDGYSTFVEGNIPDFTPSGASSFTVWVAPETYPVVEEDKDTQEKITIAGTLDATNRKGWAFTLDKTGHYAFECYAGGWQVLVNATDLLPCYEWSLLAVVNDPENGKITLYRNGEQVGEAKSLGAVGNESTLLTVGKTYGENGAYLVKSFNGLIDDINVYDGVLTNTELNATPQNPADLTIPEERFAKDLLRPKYHGMPGANWTNETHGMTYSEGKYHVFFQKNANGPYMTRLHWGHLTSDNLYDWTEERIAIAPSENFDTKGCWSGCIFTDEEITGNLPNAIYTGVDYIKAYIVQASPEDASLAHWGNKKVIINGAPSGLSDDFRDPYFFRNGDNAYIIVGTAKGGVGATTLHRYNPSTKTWSNDGAIFFAGTSAAEHGTFWEMPNITKMDNGKWLFTVTPQNTSNGVHTLCWVGEINADGTFKPDVENAFDLELFNGLGYGLLSPTIYQKDGKTILMGIVPDKLATEENLQLGWAHLYSFPREIALNEKGKLVQKPFTDLVGLRGGEGFEEENLVIDGSKAITGIGGRHFEVKGEFTVGTTPFGFNIFKNGKGEASITYSPTDNKLEVNLTKLNRKTNDRNSFGGRYVAVLPEKPEPGSNMTIDVWVDGSILDIFVNDTYATSVRVFPTDSDANGVEVFSLGGTVNIARLNGWLLGDSTYEDDNNGGNQGNDDPDDAGVNDIIQDLPEYVNVYSINGTLIKRNVKSSEALSSLHRGIYVVGPHKVVVE